MKSHHLLTITLNFFAVILLLALIATPIYFAKNFSQVAGVKSQSPYLVVSQVEKFPNLTFSQEGDKYQISFEKYGPSQAFLSVLILNNPTDQTKTYQIRVISGSAEVFFGEDLDNLITQITVPSGTSVPISLISDSESEIKNQSVEFVIQTN